MSKDKLPDHFPDTESCLTCPDRLDTHWLMDTKRRYGMYIKKNKRYCIFNKKKGMKLDKRRRYGIPDNCPRRQVPVTYTIYVLKQRLRKDAVSNADRYYWVYRGPLDEEQKHTELGIEDGRLTFVPVKHTLLEQHKRPVTTDNQLTLNGEIIHKLREGDVVVRRDGFSRNVREFVRHKETASPILNYYVGKFDETDIKKKPGAMKNREDSANGNT